MMIKDMIVRAAALEPFRPNTGVLSVAQKRKHMLLAGGLDLNEYAHLLNKYALDITIVIPEQKSELDRDYELERAIELEERNSSFCRAVGIARDLSGFDTDSVDVLMISTADVGVREAFLRDAWRVVREFGRIIVYSPQEIELDYLAQFGMVNIQRYAIEGFYAATCRKSAAKRVQN